MDEVLLDDQVVTSSARMQNSQLWQFYQHNRSRR